MAYFLAIDAGGTSTRLAIGDEARELARVTGASVKVMRHAPERAEERLAELLERLAEAAGVDLRYVERTCVGLSGFSLPVVRQWVAEALARRVGGAVEIVGDEEIALDAAFHEGAGVLVIAGTGSNVAGRCATAAAGNSRLFRAGGWGPALGDEGSGYWIGVEAIRAALRWQDRGEVSSLLPEIAKHWRLASILELVSFAHCEPCPDFAALPRVVAQCAAGGDAVAAGVLRRAGEELAGQVNVVVGKMRQEGCGSAGAIDVAYTGSVLEHIAAVRQAMIAEIGRTGGLKVMEGAVDALAGALWRARRSGGGEARVTGSLLDLPPEKVGCD